MKILPINCANHYSSNSHKLKATTELILCGWPKSNFDAPSILKHFPRLKVLRIEHSNLTHINNDFPELAHLEVRMRA